MRLAAVSDVGRERLHNEDALLLLDLVCRERDHDVTSHAHAFPPCMLVLGVFDGMGGAAAGEVASALAAQTVCDVMAQGGPPRDPDDLAGRLARSLEVASERIFEEAQRDPEQHGMGTTATLAGVAGGGVFLAQIGDSRAYLLRGGVLSQLTRDQSLVARMVATGSLTEDEARDSPVRNVLLQAVGVRPVLDVDRSSFVPQAGDVLLLCSDGLSGELTDPTIRKVLLDAAEPRVACERLVHLANAAGGADNISCVVARFDAATTKPRVAERITHVQAQVAKLARSILRRTP